MINKSKSLKNIEKRINTIKNTKTFKEKIISNFRDIDYNTLCFELKNLNYLKEKIVSNDLTRILNNKWLYEDIIVFNIVV